MTKSTASIKYWSSQQLILIDMAIKFVMRINSPWYQSQCLDCFCNQNKSSTSIESSWATTIMLQSSILCMFISTRMWRGSLSRWLWDFSTKNFVPRATSWSNFPTVLTNLFGRNEKFLTMTFVSESSVWVYVGWDDVLLLHPIVAGGSLVQNTSFLWSNSTANGKT